MECNPIFVSTIKKKNKMTAKELKDLIDKALEKANQDLNNQNAEVNYTPDFLIGLLKEIKEVSNPKQKVVSYPKDEFEIAKRWSWQDWKDRYSIIQNKEYGLAQFDTIEECEKYIEQILKNREDEANGIYENIEYEIEKKWSQKVADYRYYIPKKTGILKGFVTKEEAQKAIDTLRTN